VGNYWLEIREDARVRAETLRADVLRGLTARPRWLLPKYFYDAEGSRLFEAITRLPEYYLTRAESAILARLAPALMRALAPSDIVELGAGSTAKLRRLLAARDGGGDGLRYTPVDVDADTLDAAARALVAEWPDVHVHAIAGDFERHLVHVPPPVGRRLVLFFGSTIGNLDPPERTSLLRQVQALLGPDDRLLLGVDLVKDTRTLEAAYDDRAGVTAAFNRNILRVINRGLDADFDAAAFRHHARYDAAASRIEMRLVATAAQRVHLRAVGLTLDIEGGEDIETERSYKFTRASAAAMLDGAGLRLDGWHTDEAGRFALLVAGPAGRGR